MKRFTPKTTADQYQVKEHNLSILLDRIWYARRPISRSELKTLSGLNKMTVCNLVAQLEKWQLVAESGVYQPRNSGRPGVLYQINPDAGLIVGVEIGIGIIRVVLTNFKGEVLWRTQCKASGKSEEEFVQTEALITEALQTAQSYPVRILGIGVAVAALVSLDGEISLLPGSLGSVNACTAIDWQNKFGIPVYVTNDGNASAVGEKLLGNDQGIEEDFIFVNVGDGLGAGIISKGDLFIGSGGFAGEIGHMTIEINGSLCQCGNRGCWENYVSLATTIQRWQQHPDYDTLRYTPFLSSNTGEDFSLVVSAAQDGDEAALHALREAGEYLGVGLANIINIFNPRYIFLGGQLCQGSQFFMDQLKKQMESRCFAIAQKDLQGVTVVKDPLDIAVIGAVALVIHEIIRNPIRWQTG